MNDTRVILRPTVGANQLSYGANTQTCVSTFSILKFEHLSSERVKLTVLE